MRNFYLLLLIFPFMEKARSITSLLKGFDSKSVKKIKKLKFSGVEGMDVYNITSPIKIKNYRYLLGRAELRDFEVGSLVMFFRMKKGERVWIADKHCPVFNLQDPFIFRFGKMVVFGGVEVNRVSVSEGLMWRTVFYRGSDIHNLRRFAYGPWGMKGIRFVRLPGGKVGLFTRPQGKKGRRGRIGFEILDSVSKIKPQTLRKAGVLKGMFAKGEWGGVNQVKILKNGKLGVLGHVARFSKDKKERHYFPITFWFDAETREFGGIKIIARRADLPDGEAKREDLYNVIYPGGILRNTDGSAKLYAGVGDAEAYEITIEDPFLEYEG